MMFAAELTIEDTRLRPPTISVVTVCLDDLSGLQETHGSLAAQTSPPRQWIVADGGSSRDTLQWLSDASGPRPMWTSERDGGIYFGMNRGLRNVTADYVLFLNSGDTLAYPGVLKLVADRIVGCKQPPALIYGDCLVLEKDSRTWLRRARPPGWTPIGMPASHQAMFFRAASIREGFDTRYRLSADYALVLGLFDALRGADFLRIDHALCRFRPGGTSDKQRSVGLHEDLLIRRGVFGMSPAAAGSLYALHSLQSWVKRAVPGIHWLIRYRRH